MLLGLEHSLEVAQLARRVQELTPTCGMLTATDRQEVVRHLPRVEIAAGRTPPELLTGAPNLRWMQQWSAGTDWLIRHPEAGQALFVLINVSGVHAEPVGDHVMAYVAAPARRLARVARAMPAV